MEERETILTVQKGDKNSRNTFIEQNTRLVWSVVKHFGNRGYDLEELFQVGCIGLIKAVDRFDTAFEVSFSTYAVPVITGEIKRFLRDNGLVRVSRSLKENGWKIYKVQERLQEQLGRSPTVAEIMEELPLTREEIVFAMEANRQIESIDQEYVDEGGKQVSLKDMVTGRAGQIGMMDILDGRDVEKEQLEDQLLVESLLQKLDQREEQLILLRYFKEHTQSQVAERLGISQVQVSRLEKKILKKMRKEMQQSV